eukprot:Rmarinus@m.23413
MLPTLVTGSRLDDEDLVEIPYLLQDLYDELRCRICSHIGVSWKMLPCEHFYCEHCVNSLMSSGKRDCPDCRKRFKKEKIKAARDRNNQASKLPVLCIRSGRDNGCEWKGVLDAREGHVAECGYQPMTCPHVGCSELPLRKDLGVHAEDCGFRIVPCCYDGCALEFQQQHRSEKAAHEESCDKKPVACDLCQESMQKEAQLKHAGYDCPEAVVTCTGEYEKHAGDRALQLSSGGGNLPLHAGTMEAVLSLSGTCEWEGKRSRLLEHRKTCIPHGVCAVVTVLQSQLAIAGARLSERVEGLASFVWDASLSDLRNGGDVRSPPFSLRGRRWQLLLSPVQCEADEATGYTISLEALDLGEGERFTVWCLLRAESKSHNVIHEFAPESPVSDRKKLGPIPSPARKLFEVQMKYLGRRE